MLSTAMFKQNSQSTATHRICIPFSSGTGKMQRKMCAPFLQNSGKMRTMKMRIIKRHYRSNCTWKRSSLGGAVVNNLMLLVISFFHMKRVCIATSSATTASSADWKSANTNFLAFKWRSWICNDCWLKVHNSTHLNNLCGVFVGAPMHHLPSKVYQASMVRPGDRHPIDNKSRAIAGRTARCRCKFR